MRETLGKDQQGHMTGSMGHMTDALPLYHMTDARDHLMIVEEGLDHHHTS